MLCVASSGSRNVLRHCAHFVVVRASEARLLPGRRQARIQHHVMTSRTGQRLGILEELRREMPQVRAGTIKAYAVAAKSRLAIAPDIPTVDEAGLPGFRANSSMPAA